MEEPINPSFKSQATRVLKRQATRAPTIDEEYDYFVPIKQNIADTFNRPSFDGMYERVEKTCCHNIGGGDKDGNPVKMTRPWKKYRVREGFLEKYGLSHHSATPDFVLQFVLVDKLEGSVS